jgi:hypothetical protein
MVLTREEIFAAKDTKIEAVEIPEWGGTVYVRSMSGRSRDRFDASQFDPATGKAIARTDDFRARYAVLVVCDEAGNLLFTDADIPLLTERSSIALGKILDAGLNVNGQTQDAVEELEKN